MAGRQIYGLKGMAAYTEHAWNIGRKNPEILAFMCEALSSTLDDSRNVDELVDLTLKTGEFGVKAMALLDEANTSKYGQPELTKVNIGVRDNPAILISGHDLTDLEQLLEQTTDTGIDVYGREGVGLKRRAADERPVDVLLRKEACHVVRLGRAAIQHAYAVCGRLPEDLGQRRPDGAADLLGVIGRRGLTGADGPDGLVDDPSKIGRASLGKECRSRWSPYH